MYPANTLQAECYFFWTSTAAWTSHILLTDVILWVNKASLALYIACIMQHAMPWPIWSSEAALHCQVRLLWLKHRNLSLSRSRVGLRLHLCNRGAGIDVACRLCMHYIHYMHHYNYAATGDGQVHVFHINNSVIGLKISGWVPPLTPHICFGLQFILHFSVGIQKLVSTCRIWRAGGLSTTFLAFTHSCAIDMHSCGYSRSRHSITIWNN